MNIFLDSFCRPLVNLAFVSLLLISTIHAQTKLSEQSDGRLVAELKNRMETSLIAARPVILELIERYKDKPERESYLFLAGLSYQDEFAETADKELLEQGISYYSRYLDCFPNQEPFHEAARYRSELSCLVLADYFNALEIIAAFIDDYNEQSVFLEEVFFRYAIALLCEQKAQEAERQIGDLKRSRGALEEFATHHRSVPNQTNNSAFFTKVVFALSEVLDEMSRAQEEIGELQACVERFEKKGQSSEGYHRIGMIFDWLVRLGDRIEIHALLIKELILSYGNDCTRYETTLRDSIALQDRLMAAAAFRKMFLTYRAYQYQFMQSAEDHNVDKELSYLLGRERAFRNKIIETVIFTDPEIREGLALGENAVSEKMASEKLAQRKDFYASKAESIAEYAPEIFFCALVATAHAYT